LHPGAAAPHAVGQSRASPVGAVARRVWLDDAGAGAGLGAAARQPAARAIVASARSGDRRFAPVKTAAA